MSRVPSATLGSSTRGFEARNFLLLSNGSWRLSTITKTPFPEIDSAEALTGGSRSKLQRYFDLDVFIWINPAG
jgi:hypothetical protein